MVANSYSKSGDLLEIMVVPRKSVEPWEMGLNAQNGFIKRTTLTIIKSNEVGKAPDAPIKIGT